MNNYCIIKVYAETSNEYVVKDNLTFDEAQEAFENYNKTSSSSVEPCMYIIGDSSSELDNFSEDELLDIDEEDSLGSFDEVYIDRLARGDHLNTRFLDGYSDY